MALYLPVGVNSADINGQLVAVGNGQAVWPPGASQPNIGQGSAPANLPGSSFFGGTSGTVQPPSGAPSSPGGATAGQFLGDVWSLPFWQNPLVLIVGLLVLSYLALRFVHWRP